MMRLSKFRKNHKKMGDDVEVDAFDLEVDGKLFTIKVDAVSKGFVVRARHEPDSSKIIILPMVTNEVEIRSIPFGG